MMVPMVSAVGSLKTGRGGAPTCASGDYNELGNSKPDQMTTRQINGPEQNPSWR